MAANDDLDDFFKKKDRKGNKHKKQPALLTNNEELLKQLVIVTSATSAFKENMDLDEDDEEMPVNNNQHRHPHIDESNGITPVIEDGQKVPSTSTSVNTKSKSNTKLTVQDNNNNFNDQQQQQQPGDEWEEFEDYKSKYDQLRLKFARPTHDGDENDDDYSDDENNHRTNFDENSNNLDQVDGEQSSRTNRKREQQKEKPAWNLDQVKQTSANDVPIEKVEEPTPPPKPLGTGAYKPPQMRGNSSVTVVSGVHQRVSKKEKPNLASTEEFPTLGTAVNKK